MEFSKDNFFLLTSCIDSHRELLFTINDATGLNEKTLIQSRGILIGKIKKLDLTKDGKILILANLKSEYEIPVNSKINVSKNNFQKFIDVEFRDSQNFYTKNDTILIHNSNELSMDSIIKIIDKAIENILVGNKLNSLNHNVKILNDKIDSIK